MIMDFASMAKYTPLFVEGLKVTVQISFVAVLIGVVVGLVMALFRLSSIKILSWFANMYIQIIRGTPVLVQLYIIYYGTYPLFGFNIPPYIAAIITFGLNSSAYVAEIIRAGIQAVDYGQMEAGRSLGMPHGMVMRYIIIPQAIKNILPALGNEFVVLIKETSVVSIIGTADLVRQADIIKAATYSHFEPYIIIAIIYIILVIGLSSVMDRIERRLKQSDYR
ncbi:MAG TPA: amino acid ABC transporter permease [Eubacteriaceae bacterium]|nr:amino acid ABC transporter permease [Eubacteriaceae bacterium]